MSKKSINEIFNKIQNKLNEERQIRARMENEIREQAEVSRREFLKRNSYPFVGGVKVADVVVNPCLNRWPDNSVESKYFQHAFQRSFVESTFSLGIGDRLLILGHINDTPGNDIWEIHTGDIAVYVGSGAGEDGFDWDYISLEPGTRVTSDFNIVSGGYIICNETDTTIYTDNGGTGRMAVEDTVLFYDGGIISSPPYKLFDYDSFTGVTVDRSLYIDSCRKFQFEYSEDTVSWTTLDTVYPESLAISGLSELPVWPVEAVYVRVKWFRGSPDNIQAYSIETSIV